MAVRLTVLLLLLCMACTSLAFVSKSHLGHLNLGLLKHLRESGSQHMPNFKHSANEQWFTQQLDHFNSSDTRTFQQRWLMNSTYWGSKSAPVFLVLGGEGPIAEDYVTGHFISNLYAQQFGALILAIEHRFYGESVPGNDSSTANLKYLSSKQALADAANFANYIKQSMQATGKFIIFGGSYSGCLSAWLQLKYPDVFDGSVASSAPVEADLDFYAYLDVLARSVGPTCNQRFANASMIITRMLDSDSGRQQLSQMFNTCTPITSSMNDIKLFVQNLVNGPSGVVQYNLDNVNYQPFNITVMCDMMAKSDNDLQNFVDLTLTFDSQQCMEVNYTQYIQEMMPTSAGRSWTWQTCKEFGFFQTTNGKMQPFPPLLDLGFSLQQCYDMFGEYLVPDIDGINQYYEGLNLQTKNTFGPFGTIDEWHALGLVYGDNVGPGRNIGPNSATVLINGTGHCADLYAPRAQDLAGLKAARVMEQKLISSWIQQ